MPDPDRPTLILRADITVNNGEGRNFNPTPFDTDPGNSVSFQAGDNSAIDFYVFDDDGNGSTTLFGNSGNDPDYMYSAPPANDPAASYTVQSGAAQQTFWLSVTNSAPNPQPGTMRPRGTNQTINVGGGGA